MEILESFIGHLIDINAENIKLDSMNNKIFFTLDNVNYSLDIKICEA